MGEVMENQDPAACPWIVEFPDGMECRDLVGFLTRRMDNWSYAAENWRTGLNWKTLQIPYQKNKKWFIITNARIVMVSQDWVIKTES